jgi:hypothetical protein
MESQTYFGPLYARLADAKPVSFRRVETSNWKPEQSQCHRNVDFWTEQDSARLAIRGWLTWGANQAGRCKFMAHSVVEEDGELYDITPIDANTPREGLAFLRHIGTSEEFDILKEYHTDTTYPPITYEEMHSMGGVEELSDDS